MRIIVLFAALVALLSVGCGDPELATTPGELEVAPASLEFPLTWLGGSTERSLTLRNTGRSPLDGTIETSGPFRVEKASFRLGGGEGKKLPIHFHPEAEGAWDGVLLVGGIEVPLSGTAALPPECPPSNDCRAVHFDQGTGTCVETRLPDGSLCGSACFDGICVEGECKGTEVDCDDGNKCTLDDCDPVSGCIHYDTSHLCQAGEDPCMVAGCEPAEGCIREPAREGLSCGPADCTLSTICLKGTCTEVETPEGGACGEETPCREQGRCVRGHCVQAPARVMEPIWVMSAASGSTLHFDGTVDPSGHLYWVECPPNGCDLVSATIDGFSRYRIRMFDGTRRVRQAAIGLSGDRLISTFDGDAVEARDTEHGGRSWRRLLVDLVGLEDPGGLALEVAAPMVVAGEYVVLALAARPVEGGDPVAGWVVGLSLEDGERLWIHEEPGDFVGMVGDEAGNVVYTTRRPGSGAADRGELVSRSVGGDERWRQSAPYQAPLLSLGGKTLFAKGEVRQMSTGTPSGQLMIQFPSLGRRAPLWSGQVGYAHGITLIECDDGLCPTWMSHLIRFDGTTGETVWSWPTGSDTISEGVLTRDSSVILARGRNLLELGDDPSAPIFECRLPPGRFEGRASLVNEVWVTAGTSQVLAFQLPGKRGADRGWLGHRGGGETTGRPH